MGVSDSQDIGSNPSPPSGCLGGAEPMQGVRDCGDVQNIPRLAGHRAGQLGGRLEDCWEVTCRLPARS